MQRRGGAKGAKPRTKNILIYFESLIAWLTVYIKRSISTKSS